MKLLPAPKEYNFRFNHYLELDFGNLPSRSAIAAHFNLTIEDIENALTKESILIDRTLYEVPRRMLKNILLNGINGPVYLQLIEKI